MPRAARWNGERAGHDGDAGTAGIAGVSGAAAAALIGGATALTFEPSGASVCHLPSSMIVWPRTSTRLMVPRSAAACTGDHTPACSSS